VRLFYLVHSLSLLLLLLVFFFKTALPLKALIVSRASIDFL